MASVSRDTGAHRSDLSVVFIVDANTSESYRTIVPARALRRKGIRADVYPFQEMHRHGATQWNVFVFHSIITPEDVADQIVQALRLWAVVVYDCDDDPFSHFGAMKYDPIYLARASHVNTVATEKLKEKVPNAQVLPNCIDYELWGKKHDHPLTVGLVGGASHNSDWRQVKEPLEGILGKYDVRLVVGGYFPGYLRHLPVEFIQWKPYVEYPETIAEIDILLCPLDDDPFNEYKSAIKAIEGMSQGAVPICSDHPVYRKVINHKKNGLLVGDWYEAISLLIENDRLRARISDNGKRWARKHRNIDTQIDKWIRVYTEARTVR